MMKLLCDGATLSRVISVILVLLTIFFEATGKMMMCRKNSICVRNNAESCCQAINHKYGICRPKIQLGKKCHKNVGVKFLSNDGIAFSSCGCAKGLTCTKIRKKRRRQKKGKKAYRIKYKCLPIKRSIEVSEHHVMS